MQFSTLQHQLADVADEITEAVEGGRYHDPAERVLRMMAAAAIRRAIGDLAKADQIAAFNGLPPGRPTLGPRTENAPAAIGSDQGRRGAGRVGSRTNGHRRELTAARLAIDTPRPRPPGRSNS